MAFIGKGLGAIKEADKGSVNQLKLKNGEHAIIRLAAPADEIISVWEHVEELGGGWKTITCLGRSECPLCKAGKKANFRSYIPVIDRTDDDKVKIFKASKTVGLQIIGLVEEYGDLTERDIKVVRQGEGLQTKYQFFSRDVSKFDFSKIELPDIEALVQPLSADEIVALMAGDAYDSTSSPGDFGQDGGEEFPF